MTPLFDSDTAFDYFSQTYSDSSLKYDGNLPVWVSDTIPDCDTSLFNVEKITPSLIKSSLCNCSMKSAPGPDRITYYHLFHLPCTHHFLATLFNKILEAGTAPRNWDEAHIKLIYKSGDRHDPSNFCPIALTSVIGKLFHKIISRRLETYLRHNDMLDTSIQKGFISGMPGVFEHIYTLSAIMQDALSNGKPLMITFIDLKNAFGSVSHLLFFDMLSAVKVPAFLLNYIHSFYSQLSVIVLSNSWETSPTPFSVECFRVILSLQ